MGLNQIHNIDDAVRKLSEPPQHNENLFDEAYGLARRATSSVVETVKDHPYAAAGVAGAAVLFCLSRGRSATSTLESSVTQKGGELILQDSAAGKVASQVAERDAVLKQVGQIPDVLRPTLQGDAAKIIPEHFLKAANEYEVSLANLKQLPLTHRVGAGQDIEAVTREIMQGRASVTGERLFPDTVADEIKRLTMRNPEVEIKEGATLTVYAENDLAKLAEKTQFKHVPQLGQFLKEFGVTEEQITTALNIQKVEPQATKRLLGQILTDEGLATKEQVDASFAKQGELKKILAEVRKAAGF